AVQEIDEGLFQAGEVVAVGVHVVGVDVGDNRQHGHEVQEGGIGLICFRNDEFALAQRRVGTGAVEPSANDEGRVHARLGQDAGGQRGGGGLAMRAGDG